MANVTVMASTLTAAESLVAFPVVSALPLLASGSEEASPAQE